MAKNKTRGDAPQKLTLGVCMIVKNEEEMLPGCLDSIKGVDEIVIVDTGSADKTIEIAKKYTTDLHFYKWHDDFSAARNYAISKCTADWLLIIDADERLRSSIGDLRQAVKAANDTGKIFITVINHIVDGNSWGRAIMAHNPIRIFRRLPEIRYEKPIHNYLTHEGHPVDPRMAYSSDLEIESGYSPSHDKDPDRTIRILTKELDEDPNSLRSLYFLALEYLHKKGDGDKALPLLQKYFALAFRQPWTNEFADVCYLMGTIYVNKEDWQNAVSCAMTSIAAWYTFKAPYVMLSNLYRIAGMAGAEKHWHQLAEKATNEGVIVIR